MAEGFDPQIAQARAALAALPARGPQIRTPGLNPYFHVGDALAWIPAASRPEIYDILGTEFGIKPAELKSYVEVAEARPAHERTIQVAWTIYRETRHLSYEDLRAIVFDGMTMRQLYEAVNRPPMDQKARQTFSTRERALHILEELRDKRIRKEVNEICREGDIELKQVKLDRQVNRITRLQDATTRFINTRLREERSKKGPEYEFWTRRSELNSAALAIQAMTLLHRDKRYVFGEESEERWSDIIEVLDTLADTATRAASLLRGQGDEDEIWEGEPLDELGIGDVVPGEIVADG